MHFVLRGLRFCLLACAFGVALLPSRAVAQGTEILGTAATKAVITDLFRGIDASIEKAKQAGDYVTAAALGRLREVVKLFSEQLGDRIDQAFGQLDRTSQDLLRSAAALVAQAQRDVTTDLQTVERITRTANNLVENTPFGEGRSYILDYRPRVIGPLKETTIRVTLFGVNLDKAEPVLVVRGREIKAGIVGPTEATIDIPVALLQGASDRVSQHDMLVRFTTANANALLRYLNVFRSDVERSVTLFRVPARIASYTVSWTRDERRRFEQAYTATLPRLEGINTDVSGLAEAPSGWEWVIDLPRRSEFKLGGGGEKSHCKDIGWNGATPSAIRVVARVDEIRNLGSLFGAVNRKPGWAVCTLTGPIMRDSITALPRSLAGTLSWGSGESINMSPSCDDVTITITMFNGQVIIARGAANEKYFTIQGSGCSYAINPRLPSDL
ncbi:MAG: hypothetical protein R3B35_12335 [Gemmatimonadales bacterium]